MRRALIGLWIAAGLAAAAVAQGAPAAEEIALYEAAQASGRVEDYQAYLRRFPAGAFADAARFELEFRGAEVPPPDPPPPDLPSPEVSLAGVTFNSPLPLGPEGVAGRSIADLLANGRPLFPPIEGLPEEVWKDQPCATCHKWTIDDLCTQAKTYARPDAADRLSKPHPLGPEFKQALKAFGEGGCRPD